MSTSYWQMHRRFTLLKCLCYYARNARIRLPENAYVHVQFLRITLTSLGQIAATQHEIAYSSAENLQV